MSNLSGVKGGGLDPGLHTPLLVLAVFVLFFSALSIGVMAVVVITMHPAESSVGSAGFSTTCTKATSTSATTVATELTTKITQATSTTLLEGPTTTFLECSGLDCLESSTTTTLPVDECQDALDSGNPTYHGFRSCGVKSSGLLAWLDRFR